MFRSAQHDTLKHILVILSAYGRTRRGESPAQRGEGSPTISALTTDLSVFTKTESPASLGRFAKASRPPAVKFAPREPLTPDQARDQNRKFNPPRMICPWVSPSNLNTLLIGPCGALLSSGAKFIISLLRPLKDCSPKVK